MYYHTFVFLYFKLIIFYNVDANINIKMIVIILLKIYTMLIYIKNLNFKYTKYVVTSVYIGE